MTEQLTYRTLTPAHERNLIRRCRSGNRGAATTLARIHEPFMCMRAKRYVRKPYFTLDDAMQAARCGLFKAIERFDFNYDVRLLTYASWWITHELQRQQRAVLGEMRPGVNAQGKGAQPVYALRLDAPLDGDGPLYLDMLMSENASPEEQTHENRRRSSMREVYRDVLTQLSRRERAIVTERIARNDGDETTMAELGRRFGISRERVRQIEVELKVKLRLMATRMGARELLAA